MEGIKEIGYESRVSQLVSALNIADETRKRHQDDLENAQEQWSTKLDIFKDEKMQRQKERDDQYAKVADHIDQIADIQRTINDLLLSKEKLENKHLSDQNKDTVRAGLESESEAVELKLRWAHDEKNDLIAQLNEAIAVAKAKDSEIKEQEDTIRRLQQDIKELKILIEEKKQIILKLERDIQLAIEEIERLKKIIEDLDRRIANLRHQIYEREREIDELRRTLEQRQLRIDWLSREMGNVEVETSYKAVKGDQVDELLAKYLINCPVPVKRLGGGFYLFGTRKIYAKILNGKLVVRVGGGYMKIEEFIKSYSDAEIIKLTKICEREGVASIWDLDLEELYFNKTGGSPKGSPSGREGSPKFSSSSRSFKKSTKTGKTKTVTTSINGSKRTTTYTSSQVVRRIG
jgi:hypothetical protein